MTFCRTGAAWRITAFSVRSLRNYSSHAGSAHGPLQRLSGNPLVGFPCPCSPCKGPRDCTCSESGSHSAASRTDRSSQLQKICLAYSLFLSNNYLHFDPVRIVVKAVNQPAAIVIKIKVFKKLLGHLANIKMLVVNIVRMKNLE